MPDVDELFNFVGYMRNYLDGFSQIFSPTFFLQNRGVYAPGRNAIALAGGHSGKAFVMAQIQIGFRPVVCHKHFAMLKRAHRPWVDV